MCFYFFFFFFSKLSQFSSMMHLILLSFLSLHLSSQIIWVFPTCTVSLVVESLYFFFSPTCLFSLSTWTLAFVFLTRSESLSLFCLMHLLVLRAFVLHFFFFFECFLVFKFESFFVAFWLVHNWIFCTFACYLFCF